MRGEKRLQRSKHTSSDNARGRKVLPDSWAPENALQLVPPKESDTTDTSLRRRAVGARFDPDEAESGRALRKPLFYTSPYLTCSKCNGVAFVDALRLRSSLRLQGVLDPEALPDEPLPSCPDCGETRWLSIGVDDARKSMAVGRAEAAQRRRRERTAAKLLQRAYRSYLRRASVRTAIITERLLLYRCAAVIQAAARGRLGRRAAATERWLAVIAQASRLLLRWALAPQPTRPTLFWYATAAEAQQLYE
ncbi:unnamed protein product [Phaeothamnion confervicola]